MAVSGKAFDFSILKRIYAYVKPYKKTFLITLSITIFLAFLSPLRPWLVQYAFDNYVMKLHLQGLVNACLIILAVLIVETS
jgi:ATP-binding cassette subfamily B multidrug efflux pump